MGFSSVTQWISGNVMTCHFCWLLHGIIKLVFHQLLCSRRLCFFFNVIVSKMIVRCFFFECVLLTYTCHPPKVLAGEVSAKNMTCRYLFVRNGLTIRGRRELSFHAAEDHRLGFHHRDVFGLKKFDSARYVSSDDSRGSGWSTRVPSWWEENRKLGFINRGNLWVSP